MVPFESSRRELSDDIISKMTLEVTFHLSDPSLQADEYCVLGCLTTGKEGLLAAMDSTKTNESGVEIKNFTDARKLDIENEKRPAERNSRSKKEGSST